VKKTQVTKRNELPSKIRLFSKIYDVEYFDDLSKVDKNHQDILFGQADFVSSKIRIYCNKDSQPADVWHTLFHEIFHIIKLNMSIDLDEEEEERIIDNFALATTHLLIENNLSFGQ
jgi:hypothetical protein